MNEIMICKRIKYAGDVYKALLELEWDMDTAEAFLDSIPDVPITEYAPVVHGRWVMKETMIRSPYAKNTYCSKCFYETGNTSNYCPNCGCRMDEKEGE